MERKAVTPELIAEAERMLAAGTKHAAIAAQLGITPYVLRIVARNRRRSGPPRTSRKKQRRYSCRPASPRGIDAITVRRIQRMLAAGILSKSEIAREAHVSADVVTEVACGKRLAVTLRCPILNEGERFLPEPIRCSGCHAMISVAPCRACRTLREKNLV